MSDEIETLKQHTKNQDVTLNSPKCNEGNRWTHHTSDANYLLEDDGTFYYWCEFSLKWCLFRRFKCYEVRSRKDIELLIAQHERISELEKDKLLLESKVMKQHKQMSDAWDALEHGDEEDSAYNAQQILEKRISEL